MFHSIVNEFYHNVLDDNYESTFGVITNGNDRYSVMFPFEPFRPTLRCSLTREGYLISNALNHIESRARITSLRDFTWLKYSDSIKRDLCC